MQLHAPQNFTLLRFKQLLWFDLPQLHDKVFKFQWTNPDTWTPDDLHPIHFLSIHDATRKNFYFDYESWALAWIGLRITYEQILGPSYGPVLQDIVNDIQQNDIGHLFDVEYIVSSTHPNMSYSLSPIAVSLMTQQQCRSTIGTTLFTLYGTL